MRVRSPFMPREDPLTTARFCEQAPGSGDLQCGGVAGRPLLVPIKFTTDASGLSEVKLRKQVERGNLGNGHFQAYLPRLTPDSSV